MSLVDGVISIVVLTFVFLLWYTLFKMSPRTDYCDSCGKTFDETEKVHIVLETRGAFSFCEKCYRKQKAGKI